MTLNGYSWVQGNVPNMVDPSGKRGLSLELNDGGAYSRQLKALGQAMRIPNPFVIKGFNSGFCGSGIKSGTKGHQGKQGGLMYKNGGFAIEQGNNEDSDFTQGNDVEFNLTDCFAPHRVDPFFGGNFAYIASHDYFLSCLERGQLAGERVRNSNSGCIIEVISHDIKRNSSGAGIPLLGFGHSWVIFTDSSGQEWEIRAGQETEFTPAGESKSVFEECETGNICANMRHYSGGPNGGIDWHFANLEGRGEQGRQVLKAGRAACDDEVLFRDIVRRVNTANVAYNAFGINSNTFASTLVTCAGVMNEGSPFDIRPSPPLPGWFNDGLLDIACPTKP